MTQAEPLVTLRSLVDTLRGLKPEPQNVLLIRSGPKPMLQSALEALSASVPSARLTQLCHAGQELEGVQNVVYPHAGYFRAGQVGGLRLGERGFDLALLLYATDRRLHPEYHEVDRIAQASGASSIVVLYWDNLAARLTPELLELKQKTEVAPWLARKTRAIAEICAFTGEESGTAEDKCDLAAARGNAEWRTLAPASEEEIEAFYRSSDFYIYALMKECDWRGARSGLAGCLAAHLAEGERVLDYGGGVGTLTLELAGRGLELNHLDLPGRLLEFARSRFRSRGLEVNVIPALDRYPLNGVYDAIACTHVLEHLPDPERKLAHMGLHLAAGGHMFLAVPFEPNPVGGAHPEMHLNRLTPESYARVMREQGLELFAREGELDIFRKTGI